MSHSRVVSISGALLMAACSCDTSAGDCGSPNPDRIFCEDFENGDLSRWDEAAQTLDEYSTILQEPGPSGTPDNHVFRLRVPAGRGGRGANTTFTPSEYDRLYARWYVAYEAGFDFTAPNHGHGLHAGDRWKKGVAGNRPQGDDWFTVNVEHERTTSADPDPRTYIYAYYRGMRMDCSDPNGACWGDHVPCMIADRYCNRAPALRVETYPPPLEHETWYCVEVMVDAGAPAASQADANGVLDLWVDGVEIGPWENMWLRTSSSVRLNHFWLGLFHHDQHSVEGLKFDDVAVSTSRIGCHDSLRPRRPPASLEVNWRERPRVWPTAY